MADKTNGNGVKMSEERQLFITSCQQAKDLKTLNGGFQETDKLTSDLHKNLLHLIANHCPHEENLDLLYFLILTKLAEGYEQNEELKFTPTTVKIILLIVHFYKDKHTADLDLDLDPSPFLIIKRILFALKHYHLLYECHVIRASLPILMCKQELKCHTLYPMISTNTFEFCDKPHHTRKSIPLDFRDREHCWLLYAQDSLSLIKTMCMIGKDSTELCIFPNPATSSATEEPDGPGEVHQDGIIPCRVEPPSPEFSVIHQNYWKCTDYSQENRYGTAVLRFNGQSIISPPASDPPCTYLFFKRGTKFYGDEYSHIIYAVRSHTEGMDESSLYVYNISTNELDKLETVDKLQSEVIYCADPCGKWSRAEINFIDKIVCPIVGSGVKVGFDNYHKCGVEGGKQCFDCRWWKEGVELVEVRESEEGGEGGRKRGVVVRGEGVGDFAVKMFALLLPKRLRDEMMVLQDKYGIIEGEDFKKIGKCWAENECSFGLKRGFRMGDKF